MKMENKTNFGYLLDKTMETFKKKFWLFTPIVLLLIFLPMLLFETYDAFNPIDDAINPVNGDINFEVATPILIIQGIFILFLVPLSIFASTSMITNLLKKNENDSMSNILSAGSKYFFKVLGATLLIVITVAIIALFATLPLLIVTNPITQLIVLSISIILSVILLIAISVYWIFTQQVIIDKNEKIINSLRASFNLVKGDWWRTFGKIFLLGLIVMIFIGSLTFFFGFVLMLIQGSTSVLEEGLNITNTIILNVIIGLVQIPFTIFSLIFLTHLYEGMRDLKKKTKAVE